ncbi:hypothetical protein AQ436_06610 [Arthrobacter sp. EpRS66]|nr:hypothetical protein AQ436_06610 [Arthrobacter sp. EpRS66]
MVVSCADPSMLGSEWELIGVAGAADTAIESQDVTNSANADADGEKGDDTGQESAEADGTANTEAQADGTEAQVKGAAADADQEVSANVAGELEGRGDVANADADGERKPVRRKPAGSGRNAAGKSPAGSADAGGK